MARGNRKLPIYEDDGDRRCFLATLETTIRRYGVRCYAFCLMNNHYHLVLATPRGNLSLAMRYLNGVYTQAVNRRHRRTGHVFEGRFRSIVVETDSYLRELARYVVLNPVKARLVRDASVWEWSSYRATAGFEAPGPGVCVDWIVSAFGGACLEDARLKYRLFVNDGLTKLSMLNEDALQLGTQDFEAALRRSLGVARGRPVRPRAWRALARPSLDRVFATATGKRSRRDRLILVAHQRFGYRLAEIASHLGLHPSTASLAVRRLEAARGGRPGQAKIHDS